LIFFHLAGRFSPRVEGGSWITSSSGDIETHPAKALDLRRGTRLRYGGVRNPCPASRARDRGGIVYPFGNGNPHRVEDMDLAIAAVDEV
ncbi:MAG: hypothetical protein ACLFS8_03085, partial [Clostridia bacterium]